MDQMLQYLPVCGEQSVTIYFCSYFLQTPQTDEVPLPMEYLSVNKGSGQAYGYVLYRTKIHGAATSHKINIVELQDNGVVSEDCVC